MVIDKPGARWPASRSDRSGAEDGEDQLFWRARNERPGSPQRGVDAKGKRVGASRCGADARRQPTLGQITPIKTQTGAPNDDPRTG